MRRVAALLAAAFLGVAPVACGGGGAEPGAPEGATLVLDFQPNAAHAGLYAAQAEGFFEDEGLDLTIREPSSTADSAKLLEAGRADFAIMDINDFGIARERGLDLVAIAAIVQRPLASVIAGDRDKIRTPADLAGKTVGVTGVPSDDAVLDTVLRSGGVDLSDVRRVNIGFNAVAALSGGKVDAATAFWNAEGVQLGQMGVPIREFRVDEFGAPRYPELVIATSGDRLGRDSCQLVAGLEGGYSAMQRDPASGLDDLISQNPDLDHDSQQAQFEALLADHSWSLADDSPELTAVISLPRAFAWVRWAQSHDVLSARAGDIVSPGFIPISPGNCG